MANYGKRNLGGPLVAVLLVVCGMASLAGAAQPSGSAPASTSPPAATAASTRPGLTTRPGEYGPDEVMLKELANLYEPVPFSHGKHAKMAEMWDGCVTCHHRPPMPATRGAAAASTQPIAIAPLPPSTTHNQAQSEKIPACKSCHVVNVVETDIRMPGLKGAYHRQCLSCHKEWMHENACVVCHKPVGDKTAVGTTVAIKPTTSPTRDDILGRMHPPLPEPETKVYRARFAPVDGENAIFRHKAHTGFGLRCTSCHRKDNCANCHDPATAKVAPKPIKPGMTWEQSHEPCLSCHKQDRCSHCHYQDGQQPPPVFRHAATGQDMDKNHIGLTCDKCHANVKTRQPPTCGDKSCHPKAAVAFPAQRPGPVVTTQPYLRPRTTTKPARPGDAG